ncbi:AAA family ATPase [Agromyces sp. NPDC058484]|uniref:MinD/ParA family ATP-binding protein n=1 Tax=Agromyces sp. NPDC058484 TaxID=3346524 RepID=UPI00365B40BA
MTLQPTMPARPQSWQRAPGVVLLGPVSDSGLTHKTCLVQRQDGQVVQLSELLNLVLATAEQGKPADELARTVSAAYGRELTTDGLHHLLDTKLVPLGLIEDANSDAEPAGRLPTADPLLALRGRITLIPAGAVNRLASWLAPLYATPVVVVALVALVAVDVALIVIGDGFGALQQVLVTPVLLLGLFGLLTVGALIHELGHAAACRYGGARPGMIGFGLYLVFPAFFTNVTDSYRLGRVGRLRTDLGGLYFNTWCVVAAGLGYLATGEGVLLLVVIVMQLQMLQQLPPTIRLDGYFILADLAGVPDLFARVRPVIVSLIPGRAPDPKVTELRPAARRIVTVWVVTVIPLLVIALAWTLWILPVIVTQTVAAITVHVGSVVTAWEQGHPADLILGVLSILFLILPLAGLAIVLVRLAGMLARFATVRLRRTRTRTEAPERTDIMSTITPLPSNGTQPAESTLETLRPTAPTAPPAGLATSAGAETPSAAHVPEARAARASFIAEEERELPATEGWRGLVTRSTRLDMRPSAAERDHRRLVEQVSRHWPGPRTISVVNGKGGVGKTVTTAMLAAVFARNGGTGVLAWDNNDTRGTLGWRTEKSDHEATLQDLLPATDRLLSPSAQSAELARYVHHQSSDKYDVLRSNPELLATRQRLTRDDFDALHEVATKYFRVVFFDSGNDESAPRWLRMIDFTDQLVVATTALGEPAESGALLLEALRERDQASARLAENAVVIVLQSEHDAAAADARRIADGFTPLARAVVTIPFDRALHGGPLRFDRLAPATQQAWLTAGAAVATGL